MEWRLTDTVRFDRRGKGLMGRIESVLWSFEKKVVLCKIIS